MAENNIIVVKYLVMNIKKFIFLKKCKIVISNQSCKSFKERLNLKSLITVNLYLRRIILF